ncbi:glycosyltransferase family 4 protein [Vibrio diabolicus]|uniref:glycosyltransferase family 4 protein n=1 Tax=Vibrio diabolicus TaxID=50719 RepID=UPI0037533CC2
MKIAFIVTSLVNKGPIIVVKDIIDNLPFDWEISVYYIDDIVEVEFNKSVKFVKLDSCFKKVDFSEYDIVHSHLLRADLVSFVNRKSIRNSISTMHSDIIKDLQISHGKAFGLMAGIIWERVVSTFSHVAFLTNVQSERYRKVIRSSVIYNGRPKPPINLVANSDLENIKSTLQDKVILGACANVVKRKGFEQVIDLLYSDEDNKYVFVLVGDGPDLNSLMEYAQEKNVRNRCIFFGKTNNVHEFIVSFDIFIMTSYSEGMPLALLEAASNKVPIVCSSLPVIKEVFSEDEVSFYELGNIASLNNAVNNAVVHSTSLSSNVYIKYLHRYTDTAMSEKYQDLYITLAN